MGGAAGVPRRGDAAWPSFWSNGRTKLITKPDDQETCSGPKAESNAPNKRGIPNPPNPRLFAIFFSSRTIRVLFLKHLKISPRGGHARESGHSPGRPRGSALPLQYRRPVRLRCCGRGPHPGPGAGCASPPLCRQNSVSWIEKYTPEIRCQQKKNVEWEASLFFKPPFLCNLT